MGHEFEALSSSILKAAIDVHKTLGPGFLESVYENALVVALQENGLSVEKQKLVPIYYHGVQVGEHRVDLYVENEMLVELKSVEAFEKIHFAIVKSYLHALNQRVALLLNCNSITLEIKRIVL